MGRPLPAAVVLGLTAGAIASASLFPAVLPTVYRFALASEQLAQANAVLAATANLPVEGQEPTRTDLAGQHAILLEGEHPVWVRGTPPDTLQKTRCMDGRVDFRTEVVGRQNWAVACVHSGPYTSIVAEPVPRTAGWTSVAIIASLSALVGLINMLIVYRMLGPISQIGTALRDVRAGREFERLPTTGMAELDGLIQAVRLTADAVADREEALASRVGAVQDVARTVAHEVRNPLQSMELLTSLLASEPDETERQELADAIHEEIRGLDAVVGRMLRENQDPNALRLVLTKQSIGAMIESIRRIRAPDAANQGLRLTIGDIADVELRFDHVFLKRAVENLISNAMDATPRKGTISVSAIVVRNHLQILVDDSGPGIPPEIGDTVWERGITTKSRGTGLGLDFVKKVVEAHEGYVRHDVSELGGARFIIAIPLNS